MEGPPAGGLGAGRNIGYEVEGEWDVEKAEVDDEIKRKKARQVGYLKLRKIHNLAPYNP